MPAGYVAVGDVDEPRGGRCPACDRPTDPPRPVGAPIVVDFPAPAWSTATKLDGDVWHSWIHPQALHVFDDEGGEGELEELELAQRDVVEVDSEGFRITRGQPWIHFADVDLSLAAAELLARLLMDAVRRAEDLGSVL
jgi:hypothetical protein